MGSGRRARTRRRLTGPLLLAKILEANETQEGSLSLVFRYADEKGLPDPRPRGPAGTPLLPRFDEGKADLKGIGGVSSATIGVLLRKLVQLEDGGGTSSSASRSWT